MGVPAEVEQPDQAPKPTKMFGFRHIEILLLFLCTTVAYMVRVSVSLGIVAMTSSNDYGYPEFDWSKSTQDTILSSFFWGYLVLQVPAGAMAAKFGGKILLFIGVFTNGLVCLGAPLASSYGGWVGLTVCRVGMGLAQGMLFPSIHGLIGKWAPDCERSRLATFVYAGSQVGTVIEMLLAGALSAGSWGWPAVYYSVGVLSLVWSALWLVVGANSPAECRFISAEEREYIETTTGNVGNRKNMVIPWKQMLTTVGFWAIVLAHSGQAFGFWTLLTEMPTYMKYILGVDIKSNGLFSALPYMAMFLLSLVFSWASDMFTNKNIISKLNARKLFNTLAHWVPAVALLGLAYLPPGHVGLAVAILTFCVGFNGAHYIGFMMVHIDMAPNFASTMMGITNGFSTIFSIMAPLSVSLVIKDETSATEWRNVFFVSIAFYFLVNLFFLLFATTDRQPWNTPVYSDDMDAEKNSKEMESKQKVQA